MPTARRAALGATLASLLAAPLLAAAIGRRGWAVDRVAVPGRLAGMPAPEAH